MNGKPCDTVTVRERGLQYGDGLFETMRAGHRRIALLEWHLDRLLAGCLRLGMRPPTRRALRRDVRQALRLFAGNGRAPCDAVVKLIVARGEGERGYRPSANAALTSILMVEPCTAPPMTHAEPVWLRLCRTQVSENRDLAGMKTLNRLDSVMARSEWSDARIFEGLMQDAKGHIVCGTMSNLFVVKGRSLATPSLKNAGVAGVMRRWVIENAGRARVRMSERDIGLETLAVADEVFITNAVIGIRSVQGILRQPKQFRWTRTMLADELRSHLGQL